MTTTDTHRATFTDAATATATGGSTVTTGLDCLAETLAFNADFEATAARRPDRAAGLDAATLEAMRRNRLAGDTPPDRLAEGRDRTIETDDGPILLRCFTPREVTGVYLHIHGGGWMFGSADGQDARLWELASAARLAVVSVEYRLAPEHPYPAAIEDCLRAARWLVEHAETEFGTGRLLVGGESAGAYLSVTTLLRLRDLGLHNAFQAAQLIFGPYDLSMTPSQRSFGSRKLLSNTDSLRATYASYAPGRDESQLRDPELSPLYADLSGLPPARMVVGTEDPLRDDTLFLAARWRAAGAPVQVELVAGAMHGFTLFPLTVTAREHRHQAEFLGTGGNGGAG